MLCKMKSVACEVNAPRYSVYGQIYNKVNVLIRVLIDDGTYDTLVNRVKWSVRGAICQR